MPAGSDSSILTNLNGYGSSSPKRALACTFMLLALAAGYFVPLHLLGVINVLLNRPKITPALVIAVSLGGMFVSVAVSSRSIHGILPPKPKASLLQKNQAPVTKAIAALVALTVILYLVLFLDTIWSFPNGYDAIAYHIDVALKWLWHGTMRVDPTWGWQYSLPSNAELPALFVLSHGITRAVAIGNLFATVLLATSIYLIAWRLTRDRNASLVAVVLAVTIPMVIYQTFQLYVDLFGAAFLVAAIALFIWRDMGIPMPIFFCGYSVGMAVGSKPVFWVYGAMFVAFALVIILRTSRSRLRLVLVLVAGIWLSSGLWFLRSALATGNPLFPIRVSIGPIEIFRGYAPTEITSPGYGIRSLASVLTQPWLEKTNDDGLPVGADRGTGPLFAAIVLPGVWFIMVRVAKQRAEPLEQILLIAIIMAFFIWTLTLLRVPRFALPIMTLACSLAAPMLQALFRDAKRGGALIALCLLGTAMNALYCVAEPTQRAIHRVRLRDFSRATYYGYPPIIDQLPPGSRIIDLTESRRSSFLLAGASLTNYVIPAGEPKLGDWIVTDGTRASENTALLRNAQLIYNAKPLSLFPKTARQWQVYRLLR